MAIVHQTTLTPSKLELIADWLPHQAWYVGAPVPVLGRAGGFRLDDPAGDVGIEVIVVVDGSGDQPEYYLVPLTYRGAPVAGMESALLGTTEHGVLGTRWIYDAVGDPVFMSQLTALARGEAQAQHQTESNALEPRVRVTMSDAPELVVRRRLVVSTEPAVVSGVWHSADGTELRGEFVAVEPR
jgi:hypothetical protein